MNELLDIIKPERWKVLQMQNIKSEKNINTLFMPTKEQFQ